MKLIFLYVVRPCLRDAFMVKVTIRPYCIFAQIDKINILNEGTWVGGATSACVCACACVVLPSFRIDIYISLKLDDYCYFLWYELFSQKVI